jgi:transketolase
MTVFVPCDAIEAKKATLKSATIDGPVYLRFSRDKSAQITTEQTPFNPEKIETYWITENPKAVIFATGWLLYFAILAAKKLEEKGINVLVANVCSIKPIDKQTIIDLAQKTGHVITVEDHQVMGGLGGAIAELLSQQLPTPMEFIGLQNTFAESGKPLEIIKKYKMDDVAIISAVEKMLAK